MHIVPERRARNKRAYRGYCLLCASGHFLCSLLCRRCSSPLLLQNTRQFVGTSGSTQAQAESAVSLLKQHNPEKSIEVLLHRWVTFLVGLLVALVRRF